MKSGSRITAAFRRKKVLIAASLCEEAHLYVWDEPLNYIDILSRMQIEDLLLSYSPTMIFAEHDAAFCEKGATDEVELWNPRNHVPGRFRK